MDEDWGARADPGRLHRRGRTALRHRPRAAAAGRRRPVRPGVAAARAAALADRLDAGDLAALDRLTGDGPDGIENRSDLSVRADRLGWIARRP